MSNKSTSADKKEEKICFVIMPISDQSGYPEGHFSKVYEQIFKPAIVEAGFVPKRVDDDKMSTDIMGKILEYVSTAEMAICDLSSKNPNVMYELGLRHAYGKPVVLICDDKTERIFDVSGINTVEYKSARLYEDVIWARDAIKSSIESTGKQQYSILNIAKIESASTNHNSEISDSEYIKYALINMSREINEIKNSTVVATKEKEVYREFSMYLQQISAWNKRVKSANSFTEEEYENIKYELLELQAKVRDNSNLSSGEIHMLLSRLNNIRNDLCEKQIADEKE